MRTLAMASIFLGTVVLGTAAASAQYDPSLAASWTSVTGDRLQPATLNTRAISRSATIARTTYANFEAH
jgi:hypothetical protein